MISFFVVCKDKNLSFIQSIKLMPAHEFDVSCDLVDKFGLVSFLSGFFSAKILK